MKVASSENTTLSNKLIHVLESIFFKHHFAHFNSCCLFLFKKFQQRLVFVRVKFQSILQCPLNWCVQIMKLRLVISSCSLEIITTPTCLFNGCFPFWLFTSWIINPSHSVSLMFLRNSTLYDEDDLFSNASFLIHASLKCMSHKVQPFEHVILL